MRNTVSIIFIRWSENIIHNSFAISSFSVSLYLQYQIEIIHWKYHMNVPKNTGKIKSHITKNMQGSHRFTPFITPELIYNEKKRIKDMRNTVSITFIRLSENRIHNSFAISSFSVSQYLQYQSHKFIPFIRDRVLVITPESIYNEKTV